LKITIRDIARICNVSTAAVSKALRNQEGISEVLTKKIQKVAKDLGYSKDISAANLATKKRNIFCLFLPEEKTDSLLLKELMKISNENMFDITILLENLKYHVPKKYLELCKERRAAGAIFFNNRLSKDEHKEFLDQGIRVIFLDGSYYSDNEIKMINYSSGIIKGINYLWNLGHRRIYYIQNLDENIISIQRREAFKSFWKDKGFDFSHQIFKYDQENIKDCIELVLNKPLIPTALVIDEFNTAVEFSLLIKNYDFIIPNDLSILSFDYISIYDGIIPKISTIEVDYENLIINGINYLIGNTNHLETTLESKLMIRESCGSPSNRIH
jgi:DNA-binding LacI/PurR family transcriptional regulator